MQRGSFSNHARAFMREIVIGFFVFLIISSLVPTPSNAGRAFEAFHHIVVLFISLSIPILWKLVKFRDIVTAVLEIFAQDAGPRQGPVKAYAQYGIEILGKNIQSLQHYPGVQVSSEEELREFSRACFTCSRGCSTTELIRTIRVSTLSSIEVFSKSMREEYAQLLLRVLEYWQWTGTACAKIWQSIQVSSKNLLTGTRAMVCCFYR